MKRQYLELGSTPCEEECAQVGADNYELNSTIECVAYKNQLNREFGCRLSICVKLFPHDFGTYKEIVVYFNDTDESERELAFEMENNLPLVWDKEAKEELLFQKRRQSV